MFVAEKLVQGANLNDNNPARVKTPNFLSHPQLYGGTYELVLAASLICSAVCCLLLALAAQHGSRSENGLKRVAIASHHQQLLP